MRDPDASLVDIVTYSRRIARYVDGLTRDEFVSDVGVQDQVMRCLSVIGEGARRTPESTRARFPAVPWTQMVAMRNRLSHEYDGIDLDAVWLTATEDVPAIIEMLESGTDRPAVG
jgi:uncharacterized protein with HEPN domain